ncbi:MAG: sensor histidine kinase, partial [Magnetococcales bacterium]|nr:sensor histidine kinase [Magnetococcales bacterium]
LNQKILAVARFATKANFKLDSSEIESDVAQFLEQYISEIGQEYLANRIRIHVDNQAKEFIRRFLPIEFSILVENLVSNAKKARASHIWFEIKQPKKNTLVIHIFDNGRGLDRSIDDPEQIFEKGFSRSRGSGLGLYHVRQVLSEMGGNISLDTSFTSGVRFEVRFIK